MLRSSARVLALLSLSVTLWGKADTILIEVNGINLASPLEITSPEALKKYTFFDGPGVTTFDGGYAQGTIVDWKSGTVASPPARRDHYQISVYWPPHERPQAGCFTEKPCLVYVAFYDYDPVSRQGFVYLPGEGERWHDLDINLLYHGHAVEGHWFRATDAWTAFMRSLIVNR